MQTTYSTFYSEFYRRFAESLANDFDDNYDEERFGKVTLSTALREKVKSPVRRKFIRAESLSLGMNAVLPYLDAIAAFWEGLSDDTSRDLLVDLLCFRILGNRKVKLPTNNENYWRSLEDLKRLEDQTDTIELASPNLKLGKFDLQKYGFDIVLYYTKIGVMLDFINEQYLYANDTTTIQADTGDFVMDIGGCWGDTALYFADKVGPNGKVFSFEFIPKNLTVFSKNVEINPNLNGRIMLQPRPIWEHADMEVFYVDRGPGSSVSFERPAEFDGTAVTQTVDLFVSENDLERIDFIKMDIEGAEMPALIGALGTIKQFKPKLAIAIYHSMDDFTGIPKFLSSLDLGYRFFLKHTTIHSEETILFATADHGAISS